MLLQTLPVLVLDGEDRLGKQHPSQDESPVDVPGLEDFLEFLLSTDTSSHAEQVINFPNDHVGASQTLVYLLYFLF